MVSFISVNFDSWGKNDDVIIPNYFYGCKSVDTAAR